MKRALIITYYWPPAGGPGVQRWLHFVRHLPEFDVTPVIFIPKDPHYPLKDESFVQKVPSDLEIIRFPIKEPYKLAGLFSKNKTQQISSGIISSKKQSFIEKLLLYIRGNFFIPDARIGWVKPSEAFLKEYLRKNPVDVIITSGPPHSLHLIGMQLKKSLSIPWIADFRDPWTTIHYHQSLRLHKRARRIHKQLEAKVLNTTDRVIVTSPTTKKEFEAITKTPIEVITNGYEEKEPTPVTLDASFSIAHIGSLLSERNPVLLWKILSEIASENSEFAEDLTITLAGTVSEDVINSLDKFNLKNNVQVLGYVSHKEALQLQQNSQLLLLLEMNKPETRAILPGKLFEYLAAQRPIIALGPVDSDIEGIIKETNSGHFFTYHQESLLKQQLLAYYKAYKEDSLTVNATTIQKYSRREVSRKLAQLINSI